MFCNRLNGKCQKNHLYFGNSKSTFSNSDSPSYYRFHLLSAIRFEITNKEVNFLERLEISSKVRLSGVAEHVHA